MSASRPLPNILWIGTDEQHRGSIGAHGSVNCRTPHLDGLASQSLVFDHAFSPTAVCAPARLSVHSGTDKFVFNFGGIDEYYDLESDPHELTNRIKEPDLQPRINALKEQLQRWLRDVESPMKEGFERTLPAKRDRWAV